MTSAAHSRLGDFWRLRLTRASLADIVRKCRAILRKQAFEELAEKVRLARFHAIAPARWRLFVLDEQCFHLPQDGRAAVRYLQKEVAAVTDPSEPQGADEYGRLASRVFGVWLQGGRKRGQRGCAWD